MVDRPLIVQTVSYWFPTRASAERHPTMRLEFSLNHSPVGGPSIAEVAWTAGSVETAMDELPPFIPRDIRDRYRLLLQPWPQGRDVEAYRRSGGILNLFTPPWGEAEDELWAKLLVGWQEATFADEPSRQEALRVLEQRWNTIPHPFFAGLTPEQVMIGGGRREAELAEEFMEHLTETYDGQPFPSEGEALRQTLMVLRGWQVQPRDEGRTPQEIILAERDELLARRREVLGIA